MKEESRSWHEQEFATIALGDQRLNARAIKLLGQLSAQPQAFINQACEVWAASKAAYRYFDNEQVQAYQMLSPHYQRTGERMQRQQVVLAVQDTTDSSYRMQGHTAGLWRIGHTQ